MSSDAAEQAMSASIVARSAADAMLSDTEAALDSLLDAVKVERERLLQSARDARERAVNDARAAGAEAARIRDEASAAREQMVADASQVSSAMLNEARVLAEREKAAAREIVQRSIAALDELRARFIESAHHLVEASATDQPTAQAGTAGAEVDPLALETLREQLGEEECDDVIETFLSEISGQISLLEVLLASDDDESKTISRTLHNLSSGCATVGARGVAELCNRLTPDSPPDRFAELFARARAVRAEVASLHGR